MKHKDIEVYRKILNHFGEIRQVRKAAEEMSELSGKLLAWADAKEAYNNHEFGSEDRVVEKYYEILCDELPDVLNIIPQLKIIFGDVSEHQERKLIRTINRYNITLYKPGNAE